MYTNELLLPLQPYIVEDTNMKETVCMLEIKKFPTSAQIQILYLLPNLLEHNNQTSQTSIELLNLRSLFSYYTWFEIKPSKHEKRILTKSKSAHADLTKLNWIEIWNQFLVSIGLNYVEP
jgi:hypothetical protein